ncbi:hypothetical protein ABIE09_002357 [Lysobacter enzymogenes]|uniref:nucleotide-binding protein n=1 Tax=Lysobacter enzymogenes TaxID=69 RepID=UPI00339AB522
MMAQDIFSEINNVVLDLQNSQIQTYEHLLKKLGRLLAHPELEVYNAQITEGLDLDTFLSRQEHRAGGLGGGSIQWPDDDIQELGMKLLIMEKFGGDPRSAMSFSHNFFRSGKSVIGQIHSMVGQLIIPFVRDYKKFVQSKGRAAKVLKRDISSKVFIVHGHDEAAREKVARFLERAGLEAIILHEQANRGRTIIEKVEAHSDVGFAVVLLTPDDEGCVKGGTPTPRARQNVLLELGYFVGLLGRDRVCALKRGELEIPSDFSGVVYHVMDSTDSWKMALGRELKAVGYTVDLNKVLA